ncbi:MAG: AMP-binding protein [Pseudomonadota bacterium]
MLQAHLSSSPAEPLTIATRFFAQVARTPERAALITQTQSMSYGELGEKVRGLANALTHHRLDSDAVAAFVLGSGAPRVIAMMACFDARIVFTPLEASYTDLALSELLEHSGASIILTDGDHVDRVQTIARDHVIIDVEKPPVVSEPSTPPPRALTDLAYIRYTSGSTGNPKGVMQSEAATLFAADAFADMVGMTPEHRIGMFQPFWPMQLIASLMHGASWHYIDPRVDDGVPDWLHHEAISVFTVPVAAYRRVVNGLTDEQFPALRFINLSGEVVNRTDIERIRAHVSPECLFINSYGSSECSRISRYEHRVGDPIDFNIVPAGRATPGRELVVLPEDGEDLAVKSNRGEIAVRSDFLPLGYWQNAPLTEKMFVADPTAPQKPMYRTGDVGVIDDSQCLHILGRIDHQVKIQGFRVLPSEVEDLLLAEPQVQEAAVVSHVSEDGKPQLVAFLKVPDATTFSIPGLRSKLRARMPRYMVPTRLYAQADFPRTYTGKVDRLALAKQCSLEADRVRESHPPGSEDERALADIWCRLLALDSVCVEDDFFELGGDSLSGAQLALEIEQQWRIPMSSSVLLEASTIRTLAHAISARSNQTHGSLIPIRGAGTNVPLFFIHGTNCYRYLRQWVRAGHPIYGLAQHFDGRPIRHHNFRALAAHYLREITAIYPDGPYAIAGHSLGGTLAHEIACQLRHQGRDVSLLALIDTASPLGNRPPRHWLSRQARLFNLADNYRTGLRQLTNHVAKEVQCRLAQLTDRRLTPELRRFYVDEIVYKSIYRRANRQHHPDRFDGDAVYLKAAIRSRNGNDDWATLISGNLEVWACDGNHQSMLLPPHNRSMIKTLNQYLERM